MDSTAIESDARKFVEGLRFDPAMIRTLEKASFELPRTAEHVVRLGSNWLKSPELLPVGLRASDSISRQDMFDLSVECHEGRSSWTDLMAGSYAWGTGTTGYGVSRWLRIVRESRDGVLEQQLGEAVVSLEASGPVAAYWRLNNEGHIHGLGPAFFTKFLYFANGEQAVGARDFQPVILDQVLARKMGTVSSERLVLPDSGFGTPQYARYLATIAAVGTQMSPAIPADRVEYLVFKSPAIRGVRARGE